MMLPVDFSDTEFKCDPDLLDLVVFELECSRIDAKRKPVDGQRIISGLNNHINDQLKSMGFKDVASARRQLDFSARKIANEREAATKALQRLLDAEQARLDDNDGPYQPS